MLRSLWPDSEVDAALEEMQKDAAAASRESRGVWQLLRSRVVRSELSLGAAQPNPRLYLKKHILTLNMGLHP